MSEVNQIVVHRSYTEEVFYNILKNDPMVLFQFLLITVVGFVVFVLLYEFTSTAIAKFSRRWIKQKSQDPRQDRFRYGRANDKHAVLINAVSFIFSLSVVVYAIVLFL
jgi:hypothetical protein